MIFIMQVKTIKKLSRHSVSLIIIIIIWQIASKIINAPLVLPEPARVFKILAIFIVKLAFWKNFCFTAFRVLISFFISMTTGIFIGLLCSSSELSKDLLEFPLSVIRSTPVVAFILIAFFWFRSDTVPVFVCVLMTLPVMVSAVQKGFSQNEKNEKLIFMSESYNLSFLQTFRYIKLPCAMPFVAGGAESTFGLCWKVVAAGEVLCNPKYGAGTMMARSQVIIQTDEVIAVTIVLVTVSFIIQQIFKAVNEKYFKK